MVNLVNQIRRPGLVLPESYRCQHSCVLIILFCVSSRSQGKPRPVATWLKDGVPLEDRSVGTRTSEVDSILFIRSAERGHSGTYTLSVQIENMLDSADIRIQVVGQLRGHAPFSHYD